MSRVDDIRLLNRYWKELIANPREKIELSVGQETLALEDEWPPPIVSIRPPKPLPHAPAPTGYEVMLEQVLRLTLLLQVNGRLIRWLDIEDDPAWEPQELPP